MYAIVARIHRKNGEYDSTRHLPTFFLDERVQGIVSEDHACRIARDLLDPFGEEGSGLMMTATKL